MTPALEEPTDPRSRRELERGLAASRGPAGGERPDLLPQVAAGEPDALRACIDRYGPLVGSIARSFLSDDARAEDAVQEVFIDLWKSSARFDPARASETSFVATIARRRLIDRCRRQSRRPETAHVEEDSLVDTDAGLARVETRDEAARATDVLRQLEPGQRRMIELWVLRGLSHRQIADTTGVPLGTVKSALRRGLMRVRELLEPGRASGEAAT